MGNLGSVISREVSILENVIPRSLGFETDITFYMQAKKSMGIVIHNYLLAEDLFGKFINLDKIKRQDLRRSHFLGDSLFLVETYYNEECCVDVVIPSNSVEYSQILEQMKN